MTEIQVTNSLMVVMLLSFIAFKQWKKEKMDIYVLIASALSIMSLPKILICLFYAMNNPNELSKIAEVSQYLIVSLILSVYVITTQVTKDFKG